METLRIGPGVPTPPRSRHGWVVEAGVILARGLLVGLGIGLGLTVWVAVGSLF
ncbi:MAG TPA: hypothetical protein VIQ30_24700 [Pseudonocardia sp.]